MKKGKFKTSDQNPSQQQKPDTSMVSEMLTPSEIEQLRQNKKDASAYLRKAFANLRPVKWFHLFVKRARVVYLSGKTPV